MLLGRKCLLYAVLNTVLKVTKNIYSSTSSTVYIIIGFITVSRNVTKYDSHCDLGIYLHNQCAEEKGCGTNAVLEKNINAGLKQVSCLCESRPHSKIWSAGSISIQITTKDFVLFLQTLYIL